MDSYYLFVLASRLPSLVLSKRTTELNFVEVSQLFTVRFGSGGDSNLSAFHFLGKKKRYTLFLLDILV